jgi:prevent-host-death family protein
MSNPSDIKSITYLKARAADLLTHINETHRPVIITQNGEARAVLQDPETYESMVKAIAMLKLLSIGEEEVRNGKMVDQEKVFEKIEKRLKRK